MSVLEFRPRPALIGVSLAVFVGCLFGAAALGGNAHDTFWWILAHDTVQAVGALALALGGVTGLISWKQRQRWTSELQVVAVDLLDETLHHAGAISQRAAYVLFGNAGSTGRLANVFQLPWTFDDEKTVTDAKRRLLQSYSIVENQDDLDIVTRLEAVSAELTEHGSALHDAAVGLDPYVTEASPVILLLAGVADLNRTIRILIDSGPSPTSVFPPALTQIGLAASNVLAGSVDVALLIHAPFEQIRGKLQNTRLKDELAAQESRLRQADAAAEGIRALDELGKKIDAVREQKAAMEQELSESQQEGAKGVEFLLEVAEGADTEEAKRDFERMAENLRHHYRCCRCRQSDPSWHRSRPSGAGRKRGRLGYASGLRN